MEAKREKLKEQLGVGGVGKFFCGWFRIQNIAPKGQCWWIAVELEEDHKNNDNDIVQIYYGL